MSAFLSRLGTGAARHWRRTILIAIVLIAGIATLGSALGAGFVDNYRTPGVDSTRAQELLEQRFPQASGGDAQIVFAGDRAQVSGAGVKATLAAVADQPHVSGVSDLQVSPDGTVAFATVQYDQPAEDLGPAARDRLEAAAGPAEQAGAEVSMRGMVIDVGDDQMAPVGELIGIAAALLLLTLLFRSVVAMTLTLVAAGFGLVGGMTLVALASAGVEIPTVAPTIGMMLGLGAGVDYALFLVARHRERLAAGSDPATAAGEANGTAGVAVLTAGAIVVVAISGLLAVGIPFVGRMGLAAGVVVATTAVAAITVMPALLGMAGRRVLSRRDRRGTAVPAGPARRGLAERWARRVSARPALSALAGVAILLALAAPVLGLRLGQPDDGTKAASTTQRVAYDRLADGFGPGFNGPLVIAVALPADQTAADAALRRLEAGAKAAPGVAAVATPVKSPRGDAATITVIPRTSPQDAATSTLVDTLRERVVPAATAGTGARAHVGGATATFDDMANRVSERLPVFIGVVVGLSLLLLMAAFRSIVVPLVSAVFNLLSIGAAYGVVTLAFQTDAGTSLLGVAEQPIVSFIPMFMFAILFGLSMDYNVFLLSRVREEYVRTGDARGAVIHAVDRTAAVIGTAGAIMTAVFLGFVTEADSIVKMMGIGLATAIAVDVTVVRMLLAPAVLTWLGDRAWGLPRWLDRLLPHVDLDGAARLRAEGQSA
ncbi:MAG TPA: MMPL family transporter [Solirubrobacteraceae bacterium]|nr:MMPL family transporter [Solirubrobacteraceae bacterium]